MVSSLYLYKKGKGGGIKTFANCTVCLCLEAFFLASSGKCEEKEVSTSPFFGNWVNPIKTETNAQSLNPIQLEKIYTINFLHGNSSQYHERGVCFFYGTGVEQSYVAARESFIIAASQGDEDSKYYLGIMFLYGLGVKRDEVIAARYFFEAALKGNSPCQYQYGMCLKSGIGVPKDMTKASSMFLNSAEQGHSDAQYEIGMAYRSGNGIPTDDSKAVYWFYKSAIQGNMAARQNIEEMSHTSMQAKDAWDQINYKTPPRKLPTHRPKNRIDTNSIFGGDMPLTRTS